MKEYVEKLEKAGRLRMAAESAKVPETRENFLKEAKQNEIDAQKLIKKTDSKVDKKPSKSKFDFSKIIPKKLTNKQVIKSQQSTVVIDDEPEFRDRSRFFRAEFVKEKENEQRSFFFK